MGALLNKQTQGFLRLLIAQARVASLGAYYGDPSDGLPRKRSVFLVRLLFRPQNQSHQEAGRQPRS